MSCQDLSIMLVQQLLLPLFCFREFHFSTLQSKLKQNVLWAQEVIIGKSSCLLLLHFILFYYILFLISNENIIKLSKKSDTQVYSKYTLGTRAIKHTNYKHLSKNEPKKIEWQPTTDNQSNKYWTQFLAIYLFGM